MSSTLDMACMELHQRLELLREKRGLSASEVARRMKEPRSTVALWFSGAGEPRLGQAVKLAEVLGTTVAEMVGETKGAASLSADDCDVLALVHALQLSRDESWRRLSGEAPAEPGAGEKARSRRPG